MVSGKRSQFNLMADPYTEEMLRYGVGGAPMTNLEAVRARKTPTFKDVFPIGSRLVLRTGLLELFKSN